MNIFTIGFTKKNASKFFELIRLAKVTTVLDVRLNNISQLAGFAKRDDLIFFLKELCDAEYQHIPELAPTKELLNSYKQGEIDWDYYEKSFIDLMEKRSIEKAIDPSLLNQGCLLCSEDKPHFCHRRLVIEYLNEKTNLNLKVSHLF